LTKAIAVLHPTITSIVVTGHHSVADGMIGAAVAVRRWALGLASFPARRPTVPFATPFRRKPPMQLADIPHHPLASGPLPIHPLQRCVIDIDANRLARQTCLSASVDAPGLGSALAAG
jgi:hypothetical protein